MNDLERRLSDLLHTGAPEPERVITASEIERLAHGGRTAGGRRRQKWGVPLLAAAGVLVAVAVPAIVIGHAVNSATPASPTLPAPTAPPATASLPSSTPSGGTPSTPARSGATCLTSQLSLTSGSRDGTAGSIFATLYFTNKAGTACSMRGFPGVSLLNAGGKIVGQAAIRGGSAGQSVRLGPGQRAQFIVQVGTATRTGCTTPRPSSQVRVYPPDQLASLRIPFSTASCSISVRSVTTAP